jgi:hypothetical protein
MIHSLENVPAGTDETLIARLVSESLRDPQVQKSLDKANYSNTVHRFKGMGG